MSISTDPDCLFCKIVAGDIPSAAVVALSYRWLFPDIPSLIHTGYIALLFGVMAMYWLYDRIVGIDNMKMG